MKLIISGLCILTQAVIYNISAVGAGFSQFQILCLHEMKACFVCPHKPKMEQGEM